MPRMWQTRDRLLYLRKRGERVMSKWTVWVGGLEVNDYHLTQDQAQNMAQAWIDEGYDEVVIEEIK